MTEKQLFEETIEYYSVDPTNRRCTNTTGNFANSCKYSPKSVNKEGLSEGCAIGRKLKPEDAFFIDESGIYNGDQLSENFPNLIPGWMKNMSDQFISKLQNLHDVTSYWDEKGLSGPGRIFVKEFQFDENEKFILE